MTDIPVWTVEYGDRYGKWVQLSQHKELSRAEATFNILICGVSPIRIMYYPARAAQVVQQTPEEN